MTFWPLRIGFLFMCMLGSWCISQLHEVWAQHTVIAILLGLLGGAAVIVVDEAVRLRFFFVGITRSKRDLIITWNSGRNGELNQSIPFAALQAWWESQSKEERL